jgi:glycosyltransferase involved in cell wall biosynthesis
MLLLRGLAGYALRKADGLFINSEYCKAMMVRMRPQFAYKFIVNYPGAPHISSSPKAPAWAAKITKPFVFSAGAFSENKNQRRLIEAWCGLQKDFSDLPCLVLVGPSPQAYLETIITPAVNQAPRADEILVPGLVTDEELAWCYGNCLFYIHPSIAEGCSSFSNYMAMEVSTPIACANTTSHPEGLADAALFFDPLDVGSIGEAIVLMWRDERLRRILAEKGRERIKEFTWEKNARIVVDALLKRLSRL